jgi:hypothetical protein
MTAGMETCLKIKISKLSLVHYEMMQLLVSCHYEFRHLSSGFWIFLCIGGTKNKKRSYRAYGPL